MDDSVLEDISSNVGKSVPNRVDSLESEIADVCSTSSGSPVSFPMSTSLT